MPATLIQVSTSPGGMPKLAVPQAAVTFDGVGDDWQLNRKYHGGRDRAVCLFSVEGYDMLRREFQIDLAPGSIGENFTTAGVDLDALAPGDVLRVGGCRILIIKMRAPCRSLDQWDKRLMKAILGRSGWVCRVLEEGTVRPGDDVTVEAAGAARAPPYP
jgi:MOSC domain-containing protein YiiM